MSEKGSGPVARTVLQQCLQARLQVKPAEEDSEAQFVQVRPGSLHLDCTCVYSAAVGCSSSVIYIYLSSLISYLFILILASILICVYSRQLCSPSQWNNNNLFNMEKRNIMKLNLGAGDLENINILYILYRSYKAFHGWGKNNCLI